jgi:acetyl esterase/lipase
MAAALLTLLLCSTALLAQSLPTTILLWPAGPPGAQGDTDADKPALTIYPVAGYTAVAGSTPVAGATKIPTGIVVCPGGSYGHLALDHEGSQVAGWLNSLGISAFVLKYRLGPKYRHPIELGDAQRAIRYVRAHAMDFGIEPNRIGIWGFSAGGHLASTTGTHFDAGNPSATDVIERQSSRPDFMILAYPVITFEGAYAHAGSRTNLLGANPDPNLVQLLSNEKQVTPQTPPTFLFHTTDDRVVPVENSVQFYLALRKAGVPAEMHIYLKGIHGVGLAPSDPVLRTWPDRLADWLKAQGYR